ncbi:MAG: hypothetical protein QNJ36_08860 [Calothrix sp. MO_167.B42]|nr:hypothetical protein [Calothrix sp. MO_167.B42]
MVLYVKKYIFALSINSDVNRRDRLLYMMDFSFQLVPSNLVRAIAL